MYCEKQTRQNRKDWAIRNYVLVEQPQEMRLADWQTVPSMVDVVWSSAGGKEKRTATAAKSQCIIIITSYCIPYYSIRSKSEWVAFGAKTTECSRTLIELIARWKSKYISRTLLHFIWRKGKGVKYAHNFPKRYNHVVTVRPSPRLLPPCSLVPRLHPLSTRVNLWDLYSVVRSHLSDLNEDDHLRAVYGALLGNTYFVQYVLRTNVRSTTVLIITMEYHCTEYILRTTFIFCSKLRECSLGLLLCTMYLYNDSIKSTFLPICTLLYKVRSMYSGVLPGSGILQRRQKHTT